MDFIRLPDHLTTADLDHPSTVALHRKIIASKPGLQRVYHYFYRKLIKEIPALQTGRLVELGSGAGFLKTLLPAVLTSDVVPVNDLDFCFSAETMPFEDGSIDAFLMVDVFHHIPDTNAFLHEAKRCLVPGGRLIMVEPANTTFSRLIFKRFHHERFEPKAGWGLESRGPLSSANGALPWIVFVRDRFGRLAREHPALSVLKTEIHSPFKYLLTGGLSFKSLAPGFCIQTQDGIVEKVLSPIMGWLGMFCTFVVERRDENGHREIS
ncbi:MAG: class I SAM-dependent methyltransferase [Desulfobacterales bacterium]|jgi:SAM-dependent methyltransferase